MKKPVSHNMLAAVAAAMILLPCHALFAQTAIFAKPHGPGISNNGQDETGAKGEDDTARDDLNRLISLPGLSGSVILNLPPSGDVLYDVDNIGGALTVALGSGVTGKRASIILILRQGATGYAVTLPAQAPGTMQWSGGAAPTISTTANTVSLIRFYYSNGTWFGGY